MTQEQMFPDGTVRRTYSNGVTWVGSANAEVTFDATGAPTVRVSGPADPVGAAIRADQYRSLGRSVLKDARRAGIKPQAMYGLLAAKSGVRSPLVNHHTPNVVYDSGCLTLDDQYKYWRGCFVRKGTSSTDPNAFYMADSAQGSGNAKTGRRITYGYVRNTYDPPGQIVQWSPGADQQGSNCTTISIGGTFFGASLSASFPLCPTVQDMTIGSRVLENRWKGCAASPATRGTGIADWMKQTVGYSATLYFGIGAGTVVSC